MAIHLTSISATFFTNLLNRLGVKPPPADGFDLINTVQPVSIVDADIVLPVSSSSITLDTAASAGVLAAPAAGTVLADSGPLAAGTYLIIGWAGADAGANVAYSLAIARRNAANAADIWSQFIGCPIQGTLNLVQFSFRAQLQANERIVIRVGPQAFGAGLSGQANLWVVAG